MMEDVRCKMFKAGAGGAGLFCFTQKYSLTLIFCFSQKSQRAQKFLFADAHSLFHTEITESTEMAAFGLALLRSFGAHRWHRLHRLCFVHF